MNVEKSSSFSFTASTRAIAKRKRRLSGSDPVVPFPSPWVDGCGLSPTKPNAVFQGRDQDPRLFTSYSEVLWRRDSQI
jgi:hypothetical protein